DPFVGVGGFIANPGHIASREVRSTLDGARWIVSLEALDRYPLYVTVARSRNDVLGEWNRRSWAAGAVGILILAALAGLVLRLREAQEIRTAKVLAANELQLRLMASLFEHGAEPGMVLDSTPAILMVNDAFTRVTGFINEEARGRHPRALFREVTSDALQQQ